MNKVYRQIWSKVKERWIVVSEKVARGGGPSRIVGALTLAAFLALSGTVSALDPGALPTGGTITAGSGSIGTSGSQMTVNQSTQQMIANWNTFNIGQNAGVRFNQPNSSATALNHIYDQNPSQILGSLSANGRIFLLNPSGIVFGQNARVDVGGLVASSLNMLDSDFLAGKYQFNNTGVAGNVINQGIINAMPGGVVALIAPKVINEGTITANNGSVVLAAGNQVSLDFKGDGLISYTVHQGAVDALAANQGLIKADGGLVVMTAQAADSLTKAVVNNSGIIEAQTLQNRNGRIMLLSDMEHGETIVSGKLDASAPNGGDGGFVETSAAKVTIKDGFQVTTNAPSGKTGTWLIDPTDFTITSSGGDMTGADVGTALLTTDLTILSTGGAVEGNGDIFVNDSITWSANLLTLNAYRNIEINRELFGSGTAQLSLLYGQGAVAAGNTATYSVTAPVNLPAGDNFFTKLGSDGGLNTFTVITSLADLQGMNGNLTKNYALGSNIDASSIANFVPIGTLGDEFSGTFDGLGHSVNNLTINRPGENHQGLFGATDSAALRNVGLVNASITGWASVGGLVGQNGGDITNAYATGAVTGTDDYVGGLVGWNSSGSITNSYAEGAVSGDAYIGGLVGLNYSIIANSYAEGAVSGNSNIGGLVGNNDQSGSITNSYAEGAVSGNSNIGGLVGWNSSGSITDSITNSYATGAVTGTNDYVGGLVGLNSEGDITNAYATGAVVGSGNYVGGLVGYNYGSTITNAYATGTVTGNDKIGGLVGDNSEGSTIENSYATGAVTGASYVGGLSGTNVVSITNSYATGDVTGTGTLVGGLVGGNLGTIENSYATGAVTGTGASYVGGLIGGSAGSITDSYAIGAVNGTENVGGLVGLNDGSIASSYATGTVTGTDENVGGLVGVQNVDPGMGLPLKGSITDSYATGAVSGNDNIGGLVGLNQDNGSGDYGTITSSYATGAVTGTSDTGSLIGNNGGTADTVYATGTVNGVAGSLVGDGNPATTVIDPATVYTNTWNGGTDNLWTTAGNWSAGWVPTIFETADIGDNSINIPGIVMAKNVTTDTDATLTFTGATVSSLAIGQNGTVILGEDEGDVTLNYGTSGKLNLTGSGTEGNPLYLALNGTTYTVIKQLGEEGSTTGTDLQGINGELGGNYVLGLDIDASPASAWDDDKGFTPIGTFDPDDSDPDESFSGTFDGLGHTVNNLTINRPDDDNQGLFGATSGAVLRNVGVVGGSIRGSSTVGGLVGKNGYYDEDPELYYGGSITNAYATGAVSGRSYIGGLVGYNVGGSITDSYATGAVTGDSNVGGLVGENDLDGIIDGGGIITNSHYNIDTVLINDAHHVTPYGLYGAQYTDWFDNGKTLNIAGYAASLPLNGGYYEISSAQGLKDLLGFADTADYKFRLTANLDLADIKDASTLTSDWYIPVFSAGEFDGNGHTLTNLNVGNGDDAPINDNVGFVGILAPGSTLGNIGVTDVNVTGGNNVGSLVGYNIGGSITGSYAATGAVTGTGSVGGLVGQNDLESMLTGDSGITNSHYNIDTVLINDAHHVTPYGLYGAQYTDWFDNGKTLTIGNYFTLGTGENDGYYLISSTQNLKDLLGFADIADYKFRLTANLDLADIEDASTLTSDWHIPVFLASEFDGAGHTLSNLNVNQPENSGIGFIGWLNAESTLGNIGLTNVSVTGESFVGGLVAFNMGIVKNSYTTGTVTGTGDESMGVGGLAGGNAGTIDNSYASGLVSGGFGVGGLAGFNAALDVDVVGTITNSYATGAVSGSLGVGGLVGYNQGGNITNTYATGAVSGAYYVGGLVGMNEGGSIDNAYATGTVNGTYYVGGLLGANSGTVDTVYATGAVTGGGAGSLVGLNWNTADTVYATGTVNGDAGSLVGDGNPATSIVDPTTVYTNTWNGGTDNLWTTAGNWSAGWVPTIFETADIGDNSIGIPGIVMAKNVITDTGATLTFTDATVSSLAIGQDGTVTLGEDEDDVTLNYGTSGKLNLTGTGAGVLPLYLSLNGTEYTVIQQLGEEGSETGTDLQGINGELGDNYVLGLDIDASATSAWNTDGEIDPTYAGFTPIGTPSLFGGTEFSGIFDGLGHSVNNLIIDTSSDAQGLFGGTSDDAELRNVGLLNANIQGGSIVGGLVGWNSGSITNAYVTGKVSGNSAVGGLVGVNDGTITNAYTTVTITGDDEGMVFGGLVGGNAGSIEASHATGTVQGGNIAGGLAGLNDGSIENSYATGAVSGAFGIGGLVGVQNMDPGGIGFDLNGSITDSYATGAVSGEYLVGGLVGLNDGSIIKSYATGDVTATVGLVGGLVGAQNIDPTGGEMTVSLDGSIDSSYATGKVTGTIDEDDEDTGNFIGGLVGLNFGSITGDETASYATGAVSGRNYIGGLVGAQNVDIGLDDARNGSIENAYATGNVTGSNNVGGLIGYNDLDGIADGGGIITNSHYNIDAVTINGAPHVTPYGLYGAQYTDWFDNGNLTPLNIADYPSLNPNDGYYEISSAQGLKDLLGFAEVPDYKFRLTANLDLADIEDASTLTSDWYIPVFSAGEFDGNGHTLTNLNVGNGDDAPINNNIGFVGILGPDSTLGNIGVTDVNVTGGESVGGLVGLNDEGTITGSYATGNVTGVDTVGGLVGFNNGTIDSTYSEVTVIGSSMVGGLVAFNMGIVENSYTTGTVEGDLLVGGLAGVNAPDSIIKDSYAEGDVSALAFVAGGLVGANAGSIDSSHASGNVTGTGTVDPEIGIDPGNFIGGLVGLNFGSITGDDTASYAEGNVSGNSSVGGLVGAQNVDLGLTDDLNGSIENAYATGTVTGTGDNIGGLVGENLIGDNDGPIKDSYATGAVEGVENVGGLVGTNDEGIITDSYATGAVEGSDTSVGGLVGFNVGSITNSYANGTVNSGVSVGGLAGVNTGSITNSYATGDVTATGFGLVGGLVGINVSGTISNSYATGDVDGDSYVGGLVGLNNSSITDSYATGMVMGDENVGGLVGAQNDDIDQGLPLNGSIANSYATGLVTGTNNVGGLVGQNNDGDDGDPGTITASFWDTETTGQAHSSGSLDSFGKTTADMKTPSTFDDAGWDISATGGTVEVWRIYEGNTYPLLRSFLTPLTITANADSRTYDGTAYSGGNGVAYLPTDAETSPNLFGALSYSGNSQGAVNASTYTITPDGKYSNQQGYDITFANGTLTINPAPVSFTGTRVYDSTKVFAAAAFGTGGTITTGVGAEDLILTGSGLVALKDVSAGLQDVDLDTLVLTNGTGLAGNYTFIGGTQKATITAKGLTIAGTAANDKVYDGDTLATLSNIGAVATGIAGEALVLNGPLAADINFNDKDVLDANLVTGTGYSIADGVGGLASNYALTSATSTAAAHITAKGLTVTGITAADKVYDATTAAIINGGSYTGLIAGDLLNLTGAGTFSDKDLGFDKTVTAMADQLALTGTDAGNYAISNPGTDTFTTTASINTPASSSQVEASLQVPILPPSSKILGTTVPPPQVIDTGGTSEGVTVDLVSPPTQGTSDVIIVTIPNNLTGADSYFRFALPEPLTNAAAANPGFVMITLQDGSLLPSQLQYNSDSKMFEGINVPEGYLPITVLFMVGDQIWTMEIKKGS